MDQDGVNDVVVGAIYDDRAVGSRGMLYVHLLNSDGSEKSTQPLGVNIGGLTAPFNSNTLYYGHGVGTLGDFNSNGTLDIL